jgi:hypothetical protein
MDIIGVNWYIEVMAALRMVGIIAREFMCIGRPQDAEQQTRPLLTLPI